MWTVKRTEIFCVRHLLEYLSHSSRSGPLSTSFNFFIRYKSKMTGSLAGHTQEDGTKWKRKRLSQPGGWDNFPSRSMQRVKKKKKLAQFQGIVTQDLAQIIRPGVHRAMQKEVVGRARWRKEVQIAKCPLLQERPLEFIEELMKLDLL